ncbi:hypothetical protein HY504_01080 [Candidatus Wolfebacteria bacterium]|nr:hypothetical protein [Candidatus Wolfebacteria bacterium]
MGKFESPFGAVELTEERKRHILVFHPEVRRYKNHFPNTLAHPQFIRRSKYDPAVYILYGLVPAKKYLAIVVKTNNRNFILTAYLTKILKQSP